MKLTITEKVTTWIEKEYKDAERFISNSLIGYTYNKETVHNALTRSFGIMMFAINELLDYDSEESQIIQKWWDDEMLPKFRELEKR